jgi:hypothetical protein
MPVRSETKNTSRALFASFVAIACPSDCSHARPLTVPVASFAIVDGRWRLGNPRAGRRALRACASPRSSRDDREKVLPGPHTQVQ